MYKIMVVDDEFYIREGICKAVDWQSINAYVVGEAVSGNDALSKLDEMRPDIILTDIMMEDMDGLSFTENVKELYPEIRVIVLSGYESFEFAKRAVELKVFQYILKPGNPDEILAAASDAISEIEEEHNLQNHIERLKVNEELNRNFQMNKFFDDIIHNRVVDIQALNAKAHQLGIPFEKSRFCAAMLQMDSFYDLELSDDSNFLYVSLGAGEKIAMETLEKDFFAHVCIHNSSALLIIGCEAGGSEVNFMRLFNQKLDMVRKTIKKLLSHTCSIGVGGATEELAEIYESYKQSQIALEHKIIVGNDCIINVSDLPSKPLYSYPKRQEKQIFNAFLSLDSENLQKSINGFFSELVEHQYSKQQMRTIFAELFANLNSHTIELGIDLYQVYDKKWIDSYKMLEAFRSLNEIENFISGLLNNVMHCIKEKQADTTKSIIWKAQAIIAKNYHDPNMSLSMISERVYLNPTYLSKLFKIETGETYVAYLTNYRMEEAKNLLRNSNLKVNEICAAVGYPNTQYFSTLFRRFFNMSPMEYREQKSL